MKSEKSYILIIWLREKPWPFLEKIPNLKSFSKKKIVNHRIVKNDRTEENQA